VPTGGSQTLYLADDVTQGKVPWKKGDWIAVATTSFSPFETEFVQLGSEPTAADSNTPNRAKSVVTLSDKTPLQYYHFGSQPPTPSKLCMVNSRPQRVACDDPDFKSCTTACRSVPSLLNFGDKPEQNYGVDERAEVGLISRTVKLTATVPDNNK